MARFLASVAFACVALALAAPHVRADETFDLELASNGFGPTGSGTITLASDPGNGTFNFTDYNPTITLDYTPYTFTEADIFDPAAAQFTLSDFNGQRRFQFDGGASPVSFDKDLGGGSFFEVAFRPDTYTNSNEIGDVAYTALASASTDVPEPGSMAGLAAALLTGAACLRKRRASRSR